MKHRHIYMYVCTACNFVKNCDLKTRCRIYIMDVTDGLLVITVVLNGTSFYS